MDIKEKPKQSERTRAFGKRRSGTAKSPMNPNGPQPHPALHSVRGPESDDNDATEGRTPGARRRCGEPRRRAVPGLREAVALRVPSRRRRRTADAELGRGRAAPAPGVTCPRRHQPRGGSLDPRHSARADQRPAPAPAPKNNKTTARLTPAPPLCRPDELRTGKARSGAEALPPAPKMAAGRASGRK